ncbi:histidine kinase [Chitiniphilus purpureus]|uniref:histidine kinase n=1 Tax=Chitiniphilus purpureus TaxID=2981137 RepID=A0ABY6DSG6_9NEIS|nr:histidine kinase [Chitiniphilus sp. CD1]UXY17319.1 histidine kinase [Chitiniphilus sp. CD1]
MTQGELHSQYDLGLLALAALNVGVIVLDQDERVRLWNSWIEAHSGVTADAARGRPLLELFPQLAGGYFHETVRAALHQGHPAVLSQSLHDAPLPLFTIPLSAAASLLQHVHVIPLAGPSGRHCLIQVNDASAAHKRESMLKRKARLLQESLELQRTLTEELERSHINLEALVQARTAELEELAGHLQDLSEREKADLARELHDELGALLTAIRIDISWLQRTISEWPATAGTKLQRIQDNLDQGIQLKRRIMEGMRPTLLSNFGLVVTLQELVRERAALNQWELALDLPPEDLTLGEDLSITLFRITQEALTNASKYAQASRVMVRLAVDEANIVLTVEDDGIGMPAGTVQPPYRHGIIGMRHRVLARKGQFAIEPVAPHGTRVTVLIPRAG